MVIRHVSVRLRLWEEIIICFACYFINRSSGLIGKRLVCCNIIAIPVLEVDECRNGREQDFLFLK
uniref:Uncharacterized protein n=1 Tax=Candidatus Methanogaster sp. ANME-2c ERB4 TaxID=2759911 RepID=A0A7G9Y821_9EURY|nr:hypothetical protein ELINAKEJ_00002 [Methanosarcinales archaeon ANME-2c ERB4]QNO44155.1 hypothetical protein MIPKNKFN_00002 [Methanosarcinales archaeon ANME-2c ERB4]